VRIKWRLFTREHKFACLNTLLDFSKFYTGLPYKTLVEVFKYMHCCAATRTYKICLEYVSSQYLQKVRKYSKFTVVHGTVNPGEMLRQERRRVFWFVAPGNPLVIAALVRRV